jgi:hypothetical protein
MNLSLTHQKQNEILSSLSALDSYETVTPGVESGAKVVRVPYKLGAVRRALVKNINTLKASLENFEEARKGLFKETFLGVADEVPVTPATHPKDYPLFMIAFKEMLAATDELVLTPLPAAVLYSDQDFPATALAILDEHGLIEEKT